METAELYEVIYREVSYFNPNDKESVWITQAILYASSEYQVDQILITTVMEAESGFDFQANAIGVNPYNPLENILGGAIYLRNQLERFANYGKYAVTDSVAAYNAGPQAVINACWWRSKLFRDAPICRQRGEELSKITSDDEWGREMKIKGVLKKKYAPNAGRLNKKPANMFEIVKYATEREREQYKNEIRSARSIFDKII